MPDIVVSNADLERRLDTSDEWIVTRTGMRERRYAPPEMAVSDMAVRAAEHALTRAGMSSGDVDCFIVATVTPDYLFPATACLVAHRLGATGKAAFDIEIACSGFVYALSVASGFVRSGIFRRVLIVGADKLSSIVNRDDRGTVILFGDGAGAAIVERTDDDCFLGCSLGADGSNPEVLYIPAGGSRKALDADGIARGDQFVHMLGREIFKSAVNRMIDSSQIALAQAGLKSSDVAWMVPHQANKRIIDAAAKLLAMPAERVLVNVDRFGNTSAASIPIVLSEAVERGLFKDGDVLLMTAFGGGISWGSIVWRWSA